MNITAEKNGILSMPALSGISRQRVSQSFLRLEATLGTQNEITFEALKTTGSPAATEQRLNSSDKFVITHLGLAIYVAATDTAADRGKADLHTWNNSAVFTGTNDANLTALFNGKLGLTVNEFNYFPALSTRDFLRVPETQEGTFTGVNAGSSDTSQGGDSRTNGLYGYYPVDPLIITGKDNIEAAIKLPASYNMAASASNHINVAVFLAKGYLVTGAN